MKRVLLGLGSNRSFNGKSPLQILQRAQIDLSKQLDNLVFSSVYKTKAMYVEDQDDFYNMAAIGYVSDDINPFDFLLSLNKIEAKYGRDRNKEIHYGPRSLDIDIELFGDEVISTPILQVPHVRMEERAFVLVPALEILNEDADEVLRDKYTVCLENLQKNGQADGVVKLGGNLNGKSD